MYPLGLQSWCTEAERHILHSEAVVEGVGDSGSGGIVGVLLNNPLVEALANFHLHTLLF